MPRVTLRRPLLPRPAGLVATQEAADPFAFCDVVTTTTHKSLRGACRLGTGDGRRGSHAWITCSGTAVFPNLLALPFVLPSQLLHPTAGPRAGMIFFKKDDRGFEKRINQAVFPALQGGPHEHQIAAIATQLKEVATPEFKKYTQQVSYSATRDAGAGAHALLPANGVCGSIASGCFSTSGG